MYAVFRSSHLRECALKVCHSDLHKHVNSTQTLLTRRRNRRRVSCSSGQSACRVIRRSFLLCRHHPHRMFPYSNERQESMLRLVFILRSHELTRRVRAGGPPREPGPRSPAAGSPARETGDGSAVASSLCVFRLLVVGASLRVPVSCKGIILMSLTEQGVKSFACGYRSCVSRRATVVARSLNPPTVQQGEGFWLSVWVFKLKIDHKRCAWSSTRVSMRANCSALVC